MRMTPGFADIDRRLATGLVTQAIQQVWITRHGPPEVLQVREAPMPNPGGSEILIKVVAAGVNFADVLARVGIYPDAPRPPCVIGYEVAGEVVALGRSVSAFSVGDRVIAPTHFGGYSSYVCVPEHQAFPLPEGLGFAEGAALPTTYLTAYQLVIAMGRVQPGETLLVYSAAGGVGLAVIDLAAIIGAKVIGVASSSKHDFLRARGLFGVIDAEADDIVTRVMDLTLGGGVDLALDPNGGRSWRDSNACLRPTGRLGVYGFSAAVVANGRWLPAARALAGVPWLHFTPFSLMNNNRGIFGVNMRHIWQDFAPVHAWMREILAWQAQGKIRLTVGRSFPLADAAAAHRHLQDRSNIGKIVLLP
jgi:NADPH:quinone reductase-like Zn-dependent oxidoreductase